MEERQQVGEAERGRLSRDPLGKTPKEKGEGKTEGRPQEEGGWVKFRKNGKGVHIKVSCMGPGRLEKPGRGKMSNSIQGGVGSAEWWRMGEDRRRSKS